VLEAVDALRVVARADALDNPHLTDAAVLLRIAEDEALVLGGEIDVDDPAAIIVRDSGWVVWRVGKSELRASLARLCAFPIAAGLNQGMVAGLPTKVWIDGDHSMVLVAAAYAAEFEERFS
jgi:hypothetical protein